MSQPLEGGRRVACVQQADASSNISTILRSSASSGKNTRRVLIVDDEQNILSSLRRLLRRESYELVTAGNGKEALRLIEEQPVHVVISDYRMPGVTGIELLREIQQRWPDTVRIVLSGYSEVKAIISAINEGAIYKFISKPWNDEEILLNIRRAVEQYELAEENKRMAREINKQNERLLELNRQLDKRADDACTGQSLAQELLEVIDAGMVVVDQNGLVVTANRKVSEILDLEKEELIGIPASTVFPDTLYEALFKENASNKDGMSGRLELEVRKLQWRARSLGEAENYRGKLVTLWEEVG